MVDDRSSANPAEADATLLDARRVRRDLQSEMTRDHLDALRHVSRHATSARARTTSPRCSRPSAPRRSTRSIDEAVPAGHPRSRRRSTCRRPRASTTTSRGCATIAAKNQVFRSFIGLGYYDTITPAVILRNVMENPGWYTPYTPYQAEIAQGRLESLLNFQTMVRDLTGMEIANASLLDEATAAAEAMTLLHRVQGEARRRSATRSSCRSRASRRRSTCCESRAEPLGLDGPGRRCRRHAEFDADRLRRCSLQYPDEAGRGRATCGAFIARAHAAGVLVAVATDLLALTLLDAARRDGRRRRRRQLAALRRAARATAARTRRSSRRARRSCARCPAASSACRSTRTASRAYRMALQTREQHIRREKATSNICTAQALLANMAAMYAVYHGPEGLKAIATPRARARARRSSAALTALGLPPGERRATSTRCASSSATASRGDADRGGADAARHQLPLRRTTARSASRSTRRSTCADLAAIVDVFATRGRQAGADVGAARHRARRRATCPPALARTSAVPDASGVQHASLRDAR